MLGSIANRAMGSLEKPRVQNLETNGVSVEEILLRNNRIFAVFIGVGVAVAALIILIMILRWDFNPG